MDITLTKRLVCSFSRETPPKVKGIWWILRICFFFRLIYGCYCHDFGEEYNISVALVSDVVILLIGLHRQNRVETDVWSVTRRKKKFIFFCINQQGRESNDYTATYNETRRVFPMSCTFLKWSVYAALCLLLVEWYYVECNSMISTLASFS